MILQRVSPVTHSIGNCLKRVIVIVASVIFFQNPMSQQNMLGMPLPHASSSLAAQTVTHDLQPSACISCWAKWTEN